MVRLSRETLVAAVVLGFCAPGVLPMTITGPSSAQSNGPITFTWTSVSTDPTIFEIDIDTALNSLNQSDSYFITQNLDTASGSATFNLPDLAIGTHRIAFSSNDGFQILDEGSIEILAVGATPPPSTSPSSTPSSSTAPATSRPAPPPDTSSSSSSSTSDPPPIIHTASSISFISQSSSAQTTTSSSSFVLSSPPIPSNSSISSIPSIPSISSISSISQSSSPQIATSGPQNGALKHNTNAGAIAGGVVGGTMVTLLALLGWWYLRRRGASGEKSPNEIRPFLASPVNSAFTGAPASYNGSDNHEFRPWEGSGTSSVSSTATPAVSSAAAPAPIISTRTAAGVTDLKQPVMDPPVVAATQPDAGPSREELLEEVQRLRQHVDLIPPPSYPGL